MVIIVMNVTVNVQAGRHGGDVKNSTSGPTHQFSCVFSQILSCY